MKRTLFFATLLLSAVALLTTSCGTGDKIGSVSMQVVGSSGAGVVDLKGLGGTLQLQVTANYTSGKQIDETNFATYIVQAQGFAQYRGFTSNPVFIPVASAASNQTGMNGQCGP